MIATVSAVHAPERRRRPRMPAHGLEVRVRVKGHFRTRAVEAIDFNRHGIAIAIPLALAKHTELRLALRLGDWFVEDVIGVIHNCLAHGDRFRCGIQFRTRSREQFDRPAVEAGLRAIESALNEVTR